MCTQRTLGTNVHTTHLGHHGAKLEALPLNHDVVHDLSCSSSSNSSSDTSSVKFAQPLVVYKTHFIHFIGDLAWAWRVLRKTGKKPFPVLTLLVITAVLVRVRRYYFAWHCSCLKGKP
jgi:hypothetical protein